MNFGVLGLPLFLALLSLVSNQIEPAQASCQLTQPQVEGETRLFATSYAGGYRLLRTDKLDVGATIHLICSATDVVSTSCQSNGQFDRALPVGNCNKPPKATTELVADSSCDVQMYRVGYSINQQFLELYRSCYDKAGVRAKFVVHDAHQYSIVTNRPEQKPTTDFIITGKQAETFKADKIYERFKLLLGANQLYIKSATQVILDRGHLAPSADFLFVNNMVATFKYIDFVPQFYSINRGGGNWRFIEDWVRKRLQISQQAKVVSGAIDVLELEDFQGKMVPIYLGANNINPVPKWMFKYVDDDYATYVFITYNNIFDANQPSPICRTMACPISFSATMTAGYTYCCHPYDFKAKYLANLNI